jgi:hypothetical protein
MGDYSDGTISATLWVESDNFHPDAITDCLREEPSNVQIKGGLTGSRKTFFKKHFWDMHLGEGDPDYFYDVMRPKIIGLLGAKREELCKLRIDHSCSVWLTIVVRISVNHIGILFDSKDMTVMGEAGVGIDLSIYDSEAEGGKGA